MVEIARLPLHGRMPYAKVDTSGRLHLVYIADNDLYYTSSVTAGAELEPSMRVNDRAQFVAGGLFRGPELALDDGGTIHIVWYNRAYELELGSVTHGVMYSAIRRGQPPAPARYIAQGVADGYSIAAGGPSLVVGWHDDEKLFIRRRLNGASQFDKPQVLKALPCECCDTALEIAGNQTLYLLYRDRQDNRRDMFLVQVDLVTGAERRQRLDTDSWIIEACPVSGAGLAVLESQAIATWEHDGRVLAATVGLPSLAPSRPVRVGSGKYPFVLRSGNAALIAWKSGKTLNWSIVDSLSLVILDRGTASSDNYDRSAGVATADGRFVLFP